MNVSANRALHGAWPRADNCDTRSHCLFLNSHPKEQAAVITSGVELVSINDFGQIGVVCDS